MGEGRERGDGMTRGEEKGGKGRKKEGRGKKGEGRG